MAANPWDVIEDVARPENLRERLTGNVQVAPPEQSARYFRADDNRWGETLQGEDSPTGNPLVLINDRKFQGLGAQNYRDKMVLGESLHTLKDVDPERYNRLRTAALKSPEYDLWIRDSFQREHGREPESDDELMEWHDRSRFDQIVGGYLFAGDPDLPSMADWNRENLPIGPEFRSELERLSSDLMGQDANSEPTKNGTVSDDPWAVDSEWAPLAPREDDIEWSDYGRMAMATFAGMGGGIGWLGAKIGEKTGVDFLKDAGEALRGSAERAADVWMTERLGAIGIDQEGLSDAARRALETDFLGEGEWGDKWNKAKLIAVGSLPATGAGLGVGGLLTRGLAALGMPTMAAGAIGYGVGEAGVAAPMAGAQVQAEIEGMSHDQLMESGEYRAAYDALENLPEETRQYQARHLVAQAAAGDAAAMTMLSTFVLSAPAGAVMSKILAGTSLAEGGGRIANTLRGVATEATQEFFQSGTEQMSQNQAMRESGFDRDLWDQVLEQAVGGALSGGPLGGAFGFAEGGRRPPPPAGEEDVEVTPDTAISDTVVGPDGTVQSVAHGEGPAPGELYQQMTGPSGAAYQHRVEPLNEELFQRYVRPVLHEGTANTLDEYQAKFPEATHIRLSRKSGEEQWRRGEGYSFGAKDRVSPTGRDIRRVESFDSPQAQEWAKIRSDRIDARDPNAINPSDTLMEAISKLGGLSREEAEASGIDPAEFDRRGVGIRRVFTQKGMSAEGLAEILTDRGYSVADAEGNWSGQELIERVLRELGGEAQRTPEGAEADFEREYQEREQALKEQYAQLEDFDTAVQDALGRPEDYFDGADQQAVNLTDLAVMAREVADDERVQDALMAGSDAQAARELWEIINEGREARAEPETPSEPVAETAPEGQGAVEESVKAELQERGEQSTVDDFVSRAFKNYAMEEQGQAILDDMEADGVAPQDVAREFWRSTYPSLNGDMQRRMQRYLKSLGFEPGDYSSQDEQLDSWEEVAEFINGDLPERADYLEGIERGYVAIMAWANQQRAEAKGESLDVEKRTEPKQIAREDRAEGKPKRPAAKAETGGTAAAAEPAADDRVSEAEPTTPKRGLTKDQWNDLERFFGGEPEANDAEAAAENAWRHEFTQYGRADWLRHAEIGTPNEKDVERISKMGWQNLSERDRQTLIESLPTLEIGGVKLYAPEESPPAEESGFEPVESDEDFETRHRKHMEAQPGFQYFDDVGIARFEPIVNEWTKDIWPGFENAFDQESARVELPSKPGTERYLIEFEEGKQVVADAHEGDVELHGKYASSIGYHSLLGALSDRSGNVFDNKRAETGVPIKERLEGIAFAAFHKKPDYAYQTQYASSMGPFDRDKEGFEVDISLPAWAHKDIVKIITDAGLKAAVYNGDRVSATNYRIYLESEEEGKILQAAFKPLLARNSLYRDESQLIRELDKSLGAWARTRPGTGGIEVEGVETQEAFAIRAPQEQQGMPSKRMAKLLITHGLETAATNDDLYAKLKNDPYLDLVIETHPHGETGRLAAYFTHYIEEGGDLIMDSEMVFDVHDGYLTLIETAVRGPRGEVRGIDKSFANVFSNNIIKQGFPDATLVLPKEAAEHPSKKEIDDAAHEAATSPKNDLPQPTQAQKEANGEGNYKLGAPVTLHGVTWRVENPAGSYRFKFDERRFSDLMMGLWKTSGFETESDALERSKKVSELLRTGHIPIAFNEVREILRLARGETGWDAIRRRKIINGLNDLLKSSWYNKMPAHYARALGVEGADGDKLDAFLGLNASNEKLDVYVADMQHLDGSGFDEHKVMIGFQSGGAAWNTLKASYDAAIVPKIMPDGEESLVRMTPEQFREWVADPKALKAPAADYRLDQRPIREDIENREPEPTEKLAAREPQGAQPEGVSGTEQGRAGAVPNEPIPGREAGAGQPGQGGLFDGPSVGSRASDLSQAIGPGAVDFGRDRRPERIDAQDDTRDGRSAESRRGRRSGSVTGSNYVISEADEIGKGGVRTKARQNIEAIKIVKTLESERRAPTSEEQAALVKYVGWGGIPQIFDANNEKWAKEYKELAELLTADEYAAARRSTQDAHYTSATVIKGIYAGLDRLGFKGGKMLEPSAGIGHFFGLMPEALHGRVQAAGVELDPLTAKIAQALYPKIRVHNMGYQDFNVPDNHYDLVIGNPPFGDQKIFDRERKDISDFSIHNYFIAKAIDTTRPGGVTAVVVSRYFMDAVNIRARQYIAGKATLLGAIRLPRTAFMDNANTEVVTDILFFQKNEVGSGAPGNRATWWREPGRFKVSKQSKAYQEDPNAQTETTEVRVNQYFIDNPNMVLGEFALTGSMYAKDELTVEPLASQPTIRDLADQIGMAIASLPENVIPERNADHQAELEDAAAADIDPEDIKQVQVWGYYNQNGKILRRKPDVAGEIVTEEVEGIEPGSMPHKRMTAMIKLRDILRRQLRLEMSDDPNMRLNRDTLNRKYDQFVKKFDYIHAVGNKRVFDGDPSYPLLASLELDYDKGISKATAKEQGVEPRKPSAKKAAIFKRRVLQPHHTVRKATNANDALLASLSERGTIDKAYIEKIYDKPFEDAMAELGDRVYEHHDGSGWVTSDAYLSGNVKAKLHAASQAAERDQRYERNVRALSKVIPADLEPIDIALTMSSAWIPARHLEDFAKHILGEGATAKVTYVPANGTFSAEVSGQDRVREYDTWGTERMPASKIIERIFGGKQIRVNDYIRDENGRDKPVLNQDATTAAAEKAEVIKREFQEWVWEAQGRREELARIYNDTFNTEVEREYDGSHLGVNENGDQQPLPGANPEIILDPHQKNFVWRAVQTGKVLADHVVGAGKTFAAISAMMERKRLGLVNKPLFVVPNHLVQQWAGDVAKLYPGARVLAATKKDFQKANRRKFFGKIATGDWDSIVIAHSSFEFIAMPTETLKRFVDSMVADITLSLDMLKAAGSSDRRTVKQLEKAKERLEAKLEAQIEAAAKDDVVTFDELGVDGLVVDEAHEFKNLMFTTSMGRNIAGLGNTSGSNKAMDLFIKNRFILENNADQNSIFLTGTPISNTIAEMFTMQRYLGMDELESRGMQHFDAWANVFADISADWEIKATGTGYELKPRFRRFQNFPELVKLYRKFADVITQDDLIEAQKKMGRAPKTPPVKGGAPENIVVERNLSQAFYMDEIVKRAENLRSVDPSEDNMLKITNDARKMALDMRLIDPEAGDQEGSKTHEAADRMKELYQRYNKVKGTQLVFIDLSVPKGRQTQEQRRIAELVAKAEEGDEAALDALSKLSVDDIESATARFDVYNDLKGKLIDRGIPENEIEFIHNANTDLQKEALFEKVRQGQIRFLFGSTSKMGAGMNVQRRLVALHHLDAPWRPSDLEQREGRIIRRGNMFYEGDPERGVKPLEGFEVEIYRYATERTYDSRMWQTIENKARFIQQARQANSLDRTVEDIGGEAGNAAAMKAAASGNPLIEEEIKLRTDIAKLETLEREFKRKQHRMEQIVSKGTDIDKRLNERLALIQQDIATAVPVKKGDFAGITLRGTRMSNKKTGSQAVALELQRFALGKIREESNAIGEYRGFPFSFVHLDGRHYGMQLEGAYRNYSTHYSKDATVDPVGLIQRLDNIIDGFPEAIEWEKEKAANDHQELESARAELGKTFAQADDLKAKRDRHAEVLKELSKTEEDKKAEGGESIDLSFGVGRPKGLGKQIVGDHVRNIVANWKHLPAGITVSSRKSMTTLPEHVRRGIERADPRGYANGAYDTRTNRVFIFADRMPSLHEVERLIIHEIKGHFGNRTFWGDEYQKVANWALKVFPDIATREAARRGLDLRTQKGRETAADEVIARIAERVEARTATAKMLKFWDRFVELVRNAMRALGFKHYRPTKAEVRNLVRRGAAYVETGAKRPAKKVDVGGTALEAVTDPANQVNLSLMRSEEAERRAGKLVESLKRGQPIDRAFRKPFELFGSYDERGRFHLDPRARVYAHNALDEAKKLKDTRAFRFLGHYGGVAYERLNEKYRLGERFSEAVEAAKAGLIDRYGQSEEYIEREFQRQADSRIILHQVETIINGLLEQGVSNAEAHVMYRMMTGEPLDADVDPELVKKLKELSEPITQAIDQMGQEYVNLGQLRAEDFERWKGKYLARSYKNYEGNMSSMAKMASNVMAARRKRIVGNQFKRRGLVQTVGVKRLLRDVPESWWGRKKEKGKADKALVGSKFLVLEQRRQIGGGTIDMPGVDPKKIKETTVQKFYWPAELPIPKGYAGWDSRGEFEITDVRNGDVELWRDWTEQERNSMGEIVNAKYAIVKTYMQAANDLANGRFFADIAKNPDWASRTDPVGDSPNASESRRKVYAGATWVKVPESTVPGTKAKRYGALAGMYVRKEIWLDIHEIQAMQKSGWWKEIMTFWKLNKTARNPVVHTNNIMSNVMLMDMVDVRTRDLMKGVRSYIDQDDHFIDARNHGAFGTDMVTQELKRSVLDPIIKQLEAEDVANQASGLWKAGGRIITKLREWDAKLVSAYRLEDEVFRMATYMREIELGATPAEAAAAAREQFLNYDIRAPWVNAARQTVLPFIAYSYRAVPVIAKSLRDRPYKLAKYVTIAYFFNALGYLLAGDDDEDDERATLRPEEQGRTWLGVFRMLRTPFNDRYGNPVFIDIRRWIPAGDVFDQNQGSSAIPIPAPLQFGGPLMIAAELMLNKQGFTGEEIVNELTDTKAEAALKVADYLYKAIVPSAPWIPGSWYWQKIEDVLTGDLDPLMREYNLPLAITSALGIKLRAHDVALNRRYQLLYLERVERALDLELDSYARDLARRRIDRDRYESEVENIVQKKLRLNERRQELAPGASN